MDRRDALRRIGLGAAAVGVVAGVTPQLTQASQVTEGPPPGTVPTAAGYGYTQPEDTRTPEEAFADQQKRVDRFYDNIIKGDDSPIYHQHFQDVPTRRWQDRLMKRFEELGVTPDIRVMDGQRVLVTKTGNHFILMD